MKITNSTNKKQLKEYITKFGDTRLDISELPFINRGWLSNMLLGLYNEEIIDTWYMENETVITEKKRGLV